MTLMGTKSILNRLTSPKDPSSLIFFRMAFGLLMFASTLRFVIYGWVTDLLLQPNFHFSYFGFRFVETPPESILWMLFIIMAMAALALFYGFKTRLSAFAFFLCFTWVELMEKAMYLNHYYLVSLIAFLFIILPTHVSHSLNSITQRKTIHATPNWVYVFLRLQVALVYFYAGFAKLNSDWLLYAEPLYTWLQNYLHWPVIGTLLNRIETAYLMSWAGAVFDLTIWLFLWWPKTRNGAYALCIFFHFTVWCLFPIGVFSWVMMLAATLFFAPNWPRHLFKALPPSHQGPNATRHFPKALQLFCSLWLVFQLLFPLRYLLYPGPVNWTEEGFRFSWRVMLTEKTGKIEYRVQSNKIQNTVRIYPRQRLEPFQYRMLCTQWDMMLEYAHHLKNELQKEGHQNIQIYADAFVSLNGRASQRAVDPRIDLTAVPINTWQHAKWILPLEQENPR